MGRQFNKDDAVTVVVTAPLAQFRFVGYDGGYATSAGAGHDSRGLSEFNAETGEALSVVTEVSYTAEAGAAIAKWAYVKPGVDGKAVTGSETDHCGRALEAATGDGAFFECEILPHRHA